MADFKKIYARYRTFYSSSNLSKTVLYLITGFGTAASFIARLFIELFAVIIGSSPAIISLITSSRNLIQQIFQSTFGRISDRIGRRVMLIFGFLFSGLALFFFPLISKGWVLLIAVIIFSFGYAIYYPAFTALQGDLTNRANRAGLISMITIVGAIATLSSLLIIGQLGSLGDTTFKQYSIILRVTALLFLLSACVTLFIFDPPVKKLQEKTVFSLAPVKKNKEFRRFVYVNSIMFFFMAAGWPIFSFVRAEYATAQENTFIWAAFSVTQILTLLILSKIINIIPRKTLLFFGRVFMFYIPLNLIFTVLWWPYWWIIAIGSAVSGMSNAIFIVGQNSFILDCAATEEKGTYTGIYNLFLGVSTFFGSLIFGLIAEIMFSSLGKWEAIVFLLTVITVGRFISSLGYLLIKKPK